MTIEGFHHLQIAVPAGSEAEARRFYHECLGLPEVPKPAHLAIRGGLWFQVGPTQQLHLGIETDFRPARKAHPAFQVTDLSAIRSRVEGYGIRTIDGDPLPGHQRFYAEDPFGNRLEFDESVGRSRTEIRDSTK